MSLVLGMIAGLTYGLSSFSGAFVAVALLVLFAGLSIFQALPIALFALGVCAAIAAGDAVRARQCDVQMAGWLIVGAMPTALVVGGLIFMASEALLATIFLVAATVFGGLLLHSTRRAGAANALAPAALLHAPRRGLSESSGRNSYSLGTRGVLTIAGACSGALLALCAAPGTWIGQCASRRLRVDQPVLVIGTLTFVLAIVAIVGAGVEFLSAPALPGYTAGLYVLGAVAGMGVARRAHALLPIRASHSVVGVVVIVAALAMWGAIVAGFAHAP